MAPPTPVSGADYVIRRAEVYHWNDHAGQIAKIRKAVGLPAAR
jgi:hypothetical protein